MSGTAIVIGAGIGGLTTALALQHTGWRVEVYEQAPEIGPVGAGIGIAPNAVKALRALGLGEELDARGLRQDGLEIRARRGRRLAHLPGERIEARYGAPFYALHRSALHRLLLDSLDSASLHTGYRAIGIENDPGGATVTFERPSGVATATADLAVVADGARSGLRASLFPDYPGPTYAGYTVWRGLVSSDTAAVPPILSETWGKGARFGVAVLGDQTYWFACENLAEHERPEHRIDLLGSRFQRWHDPIPRLISATPQETLLRQDVYYLRSRVPEFASGRAVLLGDAAHAVTPDIGQGACLAIEDAVVLAAALAEHGIEAGLRAYDAIRRPRTQAMALFSGRLAVLMQNPNGAVAALRDAIATAAPTSMLNRAAGSAFAWTPPGMDWSTATR